MFVLADQGRWGCGGSPKVAKNFILKVHTIKNFLASILNFILFHY
jgi:hypothetical protein